MDQLFEYTLKATQYHGDNMELESLLSAVNYHGVLSTMRNLLGDDCESVADKITYNFEKVDVSGSCSLDRDMFEEFMNLMLEDGLSEEVATVKRGLERLATCKTLFDSKQATDLSASTKDEFGIRRHLQGDGKFSAKNWKMLYCGGSQPVLDQLKAYRQKFHIGLSVEKFDW